MRIYRWTLVLASLFVFGCGGATLYSDEARGELRDCRRVGDNNACVTVAQRYVDGDEAEQDLDRAERLFRRACADDHFSGCRHLALFGITQPEAGMSIDESVRQLERSCRRYNINACDALIHVLEYEQSGAYDPDYAQRIRDRLCADGFAGYCFRDTDNDGLEDDIDACPEVPEDFDGFEDEDGCPDPDNDGDGILDGDDACPDEAEDFDGFEDEDGCPDPDNDGDGVLDVDDACPDTSEDPDGFEDEDGCPDFDNDGDGIVDNDDHCPNEPEDYDGFEDRDGCPEEGTGIVELTCEAIVIGDMVYFDTASDVIQERSFDLLNQVADVLLAVSYVRLVEIGGHTDDVGADDYNLDLSDRRAASVMRYLVGRGVSPERLRAVGYGETRPVAPNTSVEGRATNRRVEFNIIEQDSICTAPAEPTEPAVEPPAAE